MTQKKEFVQLVESLDVKQQKQFIVTFAFTLDDSGRSDEFLRAYKGSSCKAITAITRRLRCNVPWSGYSAEPSERDKDNGVKK